MKYLRSIRDIHGLPIGKYYRSAYRQFLQCREPTELEDRPDWLSAKILMPMVQFN